MGCRNAGGLSFVFKRARRIPVQQFLGRDVDGEWQADVRVEPGAELATGAAHHPFAELNDQAAPPGNGNESKRAHTPNPPTPPGRENLRTSKPPISEPKLRLKLEAQ